MASQFAVQESAAQFQLGVSASSRQDQYMEYEVSLNVHFHLKEYPSTGGCMGLNSLFTISLLGGEGLAITKLNVTS